MSDRQKQRRVSNIKAILLDAADVIRRRGLAKGSFATPDGVCFFGAILIALGTDDVAMKRIVIPAKQLNKAETVAHHVACWMKLASSGMSATASMVKWNDAAERTVEDVASAMEGTALNLSEDEL